MTKAQKKERALVLISYAMINEGFRILDVDYEKIDLIKFDTNLDMKLVMLARKLKKLNKMFATKKIINFLNQRISKLDDNLEKECQPLYIGLLLIYLYKLSDIKKEIVLNEVTTADIKEIFKEFTSEFETTDCTINKAFDIFTTIYPDKEPLVQWIKTSKKFPLNLKD